MGRRQQVPSFKQFQQLNPVQTAALNAHLFQSRSFSRLDHSCCKRVVSKCSGAPDGCSVSENSSVPCFPVVNQVATSIYDSPGPFDVLFGAEDGCVVVRLPLAIRALSPNVVHRAVCYCANVPICNRLSYEVTVLAGQGSTDVLQGFYLVEVSRKGLIFCSLVNLLGVLAGRNDFLLEHVNGLLQIVNL